MVVTIAGVSLGLAHAAGTASFSLTPSSGSYDVNAVFNVLVYENSGVETVNAVQADLTYDQSKLQFVSVSATGSPFTTCTQTSGGSGNVSIQCALLGSSTSGNQLIGTVTYKALVGSGSTAVNLAASSHILRSTDNTDIWSGIITGATYNLTTPATPPPATCPSGQIGTPPNCTIPPPATSPSSSSVTKSTATAIPTTSVTKPNATTTPTPVLSAASQHANPAAPVPVSKTNDSNKGFMVAIKVVDSRGTVSTGTAVTLDDNITTKTDSTGIASFTNVSASKHDVVVKSASGKVKLVINVKGDKSVSYVQRFDVKLAQPKSAALLWLVTGSALLLLAAGGLFVWRKSWKGVLPRRVDQATLLGSTQNNIVYPSSKAASPTPNNQISPAPASTQSTPPTGSKDTLPPVV